MIHSFWVPEFGQKSDAVPGIETTLDDHADPDRQLLGRLHRALRARARDDASAVQVVDRADYEAFLESAAGGGSAPGGAEDGAAVFASAGCGGCHAFEPAGTDAAVGPSLDEFDRGTRAIRSATSIVDPSATLAPGYQDGVMPTTFGSSLSDEQLDALVQYLADGRRPNRDGDATSVTEIVHSPPEHHAPDRRRRRRGSPACARRAICAPPGRPPSSGRSAFGLVVFFRWLAHYEPIVDWTIITVVASLTLAPLGFLTGIGAFDYWAYYVSGRPTRPEDHSSHGATSWKDYFRVNTDHKVIGVQYLVTTFFFFVIGGMMAMVFRAELAKPGPAVRRHADLQRPDLRARGADDLPLHHPCLRRARELRRAADARRARTWPSRA